MNNYIIRIDGAYFVGFNPNETSGKTSHMGWGPQSSEMEVVQVSYHQKDAKVLEGNINLNSFFSKLYDRLRYGEFGFSSLEIEKIKEMDKS